MRYRLIEAKTAQQPVSLLCSVLGVSRAGYYAWKDRPISPRERRDRELLALIRQIHDESEGSYGWPRIHAELRHRGVRVSRKRVARLMRQNGLSGLLVRRRGKTTIRVPGVRPAPDLVARDFNPAEPNRLWAADLTEIATWEGTLYLAAIIDCYSRRCVGWAMAEHMRAELVVEALEMAVWQRKPDPGLIHHSDQGSQGGFTRSSQHLDVRSCDGQAGWMDDGVDGPLGDEVAGQAIASTGGRAVVLT
jgi:putative transposase